METVSVTVGDDPYDKPAWSRQCLTRRPIVHNPVFVLRKSTWPNAPSILADWASHHFMTGLKLTPDRKTGYSWLSGTSWATGIPSSGYSTWQARSWSTTVEFRGPTRSSSRCPALEGYV